MYTPIKGKFIKKPPVPQGRSLADGIDGVLNVVNELKATKNKVITAVDSKIAEIDARIDKIDQTQEQFINVVDEARSSIQATQDEAIAAIKEIKKGEPGEDADEERILEKLYQKVPRLDEEKLRADILSSIPTFDGKKLKKEIIASLPDRKADLKIIQENIEIDPMSVIEKIMALPEEKRKKLKLGQGNIDGLDQTISAFRNQLARGYLHGGGGGGSAITASNGLTKVTNDIQLGGTLTSNTTISGASTYSLNLSGLTTFTATTTTTNIFATTLSLFASSSLRLATPFIQASSATAGWVFTLQNATTGEGEWNAPAASGVSTIGTIDSVSASTNGAVISGTTLYMQSASLTRPGLVNTTAQNFAGAKLFQAETSFNGGFKVLDANVGKFYNSGTANYTSLQGGTGTYSGDVELKLPSAYPVSNGQALVSTTSGVMSWATVSSSLTVGTTPITSGTVGAILFEGAGNVLQEDATNLFWNDTNNFLGIGNNAPLSKLHVADTATTAIRGILADQYSADTISSRITMRKARGTFASPTVITTGDNTASFMGQGYDGTNFVDSARLLMTSTGTISTGIVAGTMALQTANSSGTLTSGLTISSAQAIALPAYTSNGLLQTTGGAGAVSVNTNIMLGAIIFQFDGQGNVIGTGQKGGCVPEPRAGTITGWTIYSTNGTTGAAVSASVVIDVWKAAYASFPPTVANTIWGTKPSLSSASKNTATGLSIAFAAQDAFMANIDSSTSGVVITLTLFVTYS